MPELPEVETVRAGLEQFVVPVVVDSVDVVDTRGLRPSGGLEDAALFETTLSGRQFTAVNRRGKYLWFILDDGTAMLAHLGMSGQFRVSTQHAPQHRHTRIVITLDDGRDLRFLDQRTFGGLTLAPLVDGIPGPVTHIAPDPFEECFDVDEVVRRLCARRSAIKRSLLDQTLVSGDWQYLCRRNSLAGPLSPRDTMLSPESIRSGGIVADGLRCYGRGHVSGRYLFRLSLCQRQRGIGVVFPCFGCLRP